MTDAKIIGKIDPSKMNVKPVSKPIDKNRAIEEKPKPSLKVSMAEFFPLDLRELKNG